MPRLFRLDAAQPRILNRWKSVWEQAPNAPHPMHRWCIQVERNLLRSNKLSVYRVYTEFLQTLDYKRIITYTEFNL